MTKWVDPQVSGGDTRECAWTQGLEASTGPSSLDGDPAAPLKLFSRVPLLVPLEPPVTGATKAEAGVLDPFEATPPAPPANDAAALTLPIRVEGHRPVAPSTLRQPRRVVGHARRLALPNRTVIEAIRDLRLVRGVVVDVLRAVIRPQVPVLVVLPVVNEAHGTTGMGRPRLDRTEPQVRPPCDGMELMGWTKRMMEEAEGRGFWATGDVVCVDHLSPELAGFVTVRRGDDTGCAACGFTSDEVFELDELLDIGVGVLRTYWLDANEHLFHDSESDSGWALIDPVTADDLVRNEIFTGDVDDDLLEVLARPDLLGDQQWFDPAQLWLEGRELIAYSWSAFHQWAIDQPEDVDLVAMSTKPVDLFDLSDEAADGIDPKHMLSRLTELVEAHIGLTAVPITRTWHRALPLEPGELPTPARLGSAPVAQAKANRMSPKGVSMFYGADDPSTAWKEIRPDPSDRIVIGRWHPARPLRMLDLVELADPPSFFDWENATVRVGIKSLEAFAEALSLPIASGHEHDYLSTQAFTEYLRRHLPGVDGIIYRSSINGRPCCVVFADNAGCDPDSDQPLVLDLDGFSEHASAP